MRKQISKSAQIRAYLLSPEGATKTAAQVAEKFATTPGAVYNLKSEMRRRGKTLPKRQSHREETPDGEAEPESHGVPAATGETVAAVGALAATGLDFVRVRLTSQSAVKPDTSPHGYRHDCGYEGEGEPPMVCPQCGGA
jgi:hypothetical protein